MKCTFSAQSRTISMQHVGGLCNMWKLLFEAESCNEDYKTTRMGVRKNQQPLV